MMIELKNGKVLAERYQVNRFMDRGGTGYIYDVTDLPSGKRMALKILTEGLAEREDIRNHFLKAANKGMEILHPNIIIINGGGVCAEGYYFTMELLEGTNLSKLLFEKGRLPLAHAVPIFLQACDALAAVHSEGIVHRNVKSKKLFIAENQTMMQLKLLDFTLARLKDSDFYRPGMFIGTPGYSAPEQVFGIDYDHRIDIYSMGCVMYEVLTGTLPFVKETPLKTLLARTEELPVPPSALSPGLGAAVDTVVMRALAFNPAERFQSILELKEGIGSL
jgi:serine/threonine protein kinase